MWDFNFRSLIIRNVSAPTRIYVANSATGDEIVVGVTPGELGTPGAVSTWTCLNGVESCPCVVSLSSVGKSTSTKGYKVAEMEAHFSGTAI